jgi:hypothetical protein
MVLTTWLRAQVLLGGEQEVDHELDHLAGGEVLPGLLVRLFRADPDQFLEDVAHLDGCRPGEGEVDLGITELLMTS